MPKDDDVELSLDQSSAFRSIAARTNYLAMERSDAQCVCKGIGVVMVRPIVRDWDKLKRLTKYCLMKSMIVHRHWDIPSNLTIHIYTDTDSESDEIVSESFLRGGSRCSMDIG